MHKRGGPTGKNTACGWSRSTNCSCLWHKLFLFVAQIVLICGTNYSCLCSREHKHCFLVVPGAQMSLVCAPGTSKQFFVVLPGAQTSPSSTNVPCLCSRPPCLCSRAHIFYQCTCLYAIPDPTHRRHLSMYICIHIYIYIYRERAHWHAAQRVYVCFKFKFTHMTIR